MIARSFVTMEAGGVTVVVGPAFAPGSVGLLDEPKNVGWAKENFDKKMNVKKAIKRNALRGWKDNFIVDWLAFQCLDDQQNKNK